MFRRWLSGLKRKNKNKFELALQIILILAASFLLVYSIFSNIDMSTNTVENNQIYRPQQTVISGSSIKEEEYVEDSNIVNEFIDYCNEGKTQEAYNLLTNDCKNCLYRTLESFENNYCNRYYNTKKEYSIQAWVNNRDYSIYQIRLNEDIMASGEYKSNGVYQDYITIREEDGNKKININGYIGKERVDKETEIDEVDVYIESIDRYMEYEEYTLLVRNKTEKTIMLDNMERPKHTLGLIRGENGYSVVLNSISNMQLTLNPLERRYIKIQFYKKYITEEDVDYILFSKIVKDKEAYEKNTEEYNDYAELKAKVK